MLRTTATTSVLRVTGCIILQIMMRVDTSSDTKETVLYKKSSQVL